MPVLLTTELREFMKHQMTSKPKWSFNSWTAKMTEFEKNIKLCPKNSGRVSKANNLGVKIRLSYFWFYMEMPRKGTIIL